MATQIRTTSIAIGAVIAIAVATPAFVQADQDAELSAASAAEVSAILAGDQAKLAALWDDAFVVTNPFNTLIDKRRVFGLMNANVFRFSSLERTIEYTRRYGDIAVVAGVETGVWAGASPMAGKLSHFRFTAVWRHDKDGWVELARHANIVPPAPAATR